MLKTNFKFNLTQCKELSKAFFNLGNIAAATFIFGQVIAGTFDPGIFIISAFSFVTLFIIAIMLLSNERGVL